MKALRTLTILFALALMCLPAPSAAAAEKPFKLDICAMPEHESFIFWYAKEQGWDKDEGLDFQIHFFQTGMDQLEALPAKQWVVGGTGTVPILVGALRYNTYLIGIANDESWVNAVTVRPDNPALKVKGWNPEYPNLLGSPETVKGKTFLYTQSSSQHFGMSEYLKALGLTEKDVVMQNMDPAQVLATREYVDRKLDAHNKDGGAHETLARKSVQIKAGTGLTGGGTLEADRTLTVKYGNTAGTACQGNDVRLADARTPKPHKATHQTGGSDAITPADIGAADKTIQIKPGTGLSGGGTLEADRTLTVSYGTAAGTACQGNDARLSNARTPTAHKATHKTGGTDALTPADIGAVPTTVQVIAGTGLSGGGSLTANRTLTVKYGTGAGTACQGNDARVTASEAFRLSMIGVPRYWRSTTLPAGHVWANGDLALFADWPELKKIYDAGGFAGMLLAYNANSATIAANLGKWRPNAANPTGLYVPNLSEQFFRACTGEVAQAGGSTQDTGRNVVASWTTGWEAYFVPTIAPTGAAFTTVGNAFELTNGFGQRVEQPFYAGIDASRVWGEHAGAEFAPTHVCIPVIIYLGNSA